MNEKQSAPVPPSKSHKKILAGLAFLIILMFAMIAAIIIKLSSKIR